MFLKAIEESDGSGRIADIYAEARKDVGVVMSATRCWTTRPDLLPSLRRHGFSDPQIGDIALCASLRCFMSRFFEATGAGPEAPFIDDDESFRAALTVGRPLQD